MSTAIDLAREDIHRETVENLDGTTTELTYFEPVEEKMRALAEILFQEHWSEITVGPCIEGAVFEIRFAAPPKVSLLDGYLTVELRRTFLDEPPPSNLPATQGREP